METDFCLREGGKASSMHLWASRRTAKRDKWLVLAENIEMNITEMKKHSWIAAAKVPREIMYVTEVSYHPFSLNSEGNV